ncbi:MAG TPA: VOC family protein [Bauldia sp.]|nr:VOC family protein [Bauldia sp.]
MSTAPRNAAIWFEIPVPDLKRSKAFFGAVLATELKDEHEDTVPVAVFPAAGPGSVTGHLIVGKPAPLGTGPTIHLVAPKPLEDALDRVRENGGTVVGGIVTIPPGRYAYCRDPDGNTFGLFTT